jgi:hypothetical protein
MHKLDYLKNVEVRESIIGHYYLALPLPSNKERSD